MNAISCPQEKIVSNSARTGCWDNSVLEHVKGCSYCREIVQTVEWLRSAGGAKQKEYSLPDAEQVLMNARILAMQEARERALRPLVIVEFIVRVALILLLAGGIIWTWFGIQSLTAHSLPIHSRMMQPLVVSAAALAICLTALLFAKLFQPLLIEE